MNTALESIEMDGENDDPFAHAGEINSLEIAVGSTGKSNRKSEIKNARQSL